MTVLNFMTFASCDTIILVMFHNELLVVTFTDISSHPTIIAS